MKKRYFIFTILMCLGALQGKAQVDSFHILIKDTLLKAGTNYTVRLSFKESIASIEGFQFCLGYDPVNLKLKPTSIQFHIQGMDEGAVNTNIEGLLPVTFYSFIEPYQGHDILDVEFEVLNDCRVKNVLSILPAFRYTTSGSFFYSEVYLSEGTIPIATEYIPFKNVATKKSTRQISASFAPNPLVTSSRIQFEAPKGGKAELEIYNVSGTKIKALPLQVHTGANAINIDKTSELVPGMYQYSIRLEGAQVTGKFQVL